MPPLYERDADGNVLNPPINPMFEAELAAAHNAADQREINRVTDEYHAWRDEKVKRDESDDSADDRVPAENLNATRGDTAGVPQAQDSTPPTPVEDAPTHDTAAPAAPDASAGDVQASTDQGV